MEKNVSQNVRSGKFLMNITFGDEQYSIPIKAPKTHPYFIWNDEKHFLTKKEISSMKRLEGCRGAVLKAMGK